MENEPCGSSAEEIGSLACGPDASIAYRRRRGKGDDARGGRPGLLFLGGFRSDMTGQKAVHLDRFAREQGLGFVRFDYRGHGADVARFARYTVGDWISDATHVLDRLTEGPQILIGSSMGGWIMQHVALSRPDRVAGLVGIASASDFTERLMWPRFDAAARARLAADGQLTVPSLYDPQGYVITRDLIEEGRRHLLLPGPLSIRCPVRLLHGTADPDVPWGLSVELADALESRDVILTLIKDGDHRLSKPTELDRLTAAVAELIRPPTGP